MIRKIKIFRVLILLISIVVSLLVFELGLHIFKVEYPIFQTFDFLY